jgi:hypothetical protein
MLFYAWLADQMRGDLDAAAGTVGRAVELSAACPEPVHELAEAAAASNAAWRGVSGAREIDVDRIRTHAGSPDLPPALAPAAVILWISLCTQRDEDAPRTADVDEAVAAARQSGSLALLPLLLGFASELDFREDRWRRAASRAGRGRGGGPNGAGQSPHLGAGQRISSGSCQGRAELCRDYAREALRCAPDLDTGSLAVYLASVNGLLELGQLDDAVRHLEHCATLASQSGLGHPNVVRYEPDLVEALCAAGRWA